MATTDDITLITQLVVRERESRGMGFWNRMRDCFYPDSVVNISWFQGSGPDFVTASQGMASRGMLAKHRLGPVLLYQFRRPWSDGSTALLLEPLELLERLAALVPPPRRPLLAYHGLLAPRSRWRAAIVPKAAADAARADAEAGVSRRWPWARLLQRVFGFEVLGCDRCGGRRRILGAVTEPHAVRRLLAALGLAAEPPPAPVLPAA
jgi:hypothetical protein